MNEMIGQQVVVTTVHRGVFYGRLEAVHDGAAVTLVDCRNCFYWPPEVKGFLGLVSRGPVGASKVGPQAPRVALHGVTSVSPCTPEAVTAWAAAGWK